MKIWMWRCKPTQLTIRQRFTTPLSVPRHEYRRATVVYLWNESYGHQVEAKLVLKPFTILQRLSSYFQNWAHKIYTVSSWIVFIFKQGAHYRWFFLSDVWWNCLERAGVVARRSGVLLAHAWLLCDSMMRDRVCILWNGCKARGWQPSPKLQVSSLLSH